MEDRQSPTDVVDHPLLVVVVVTGPGHAQGPGGVDTAGAEGREVVLVADPTVAAGVGVQVAAEAVAGTRKNAATLDPNHVPEAEPDQMVRSKTTLDRKETELQCAWGI